MSLDVSLRFALSGLLATQRGLDVVSRNISNADTPGYTRKILDQYNDVVGGNQFGVRTGEIRRELDRAIQRELLARESDTQRNDVVESYLMKMESVQGRPESEQSLGSVVNRLRDSFAQLLDSPDSTVLQGRVIDDADELAMTLNRLSSSLLELRNQVQSEIVELMADLNRNLAEVDEYNRTIASGAFTGTTAPDLEDKRDTALREIAKLVDITYFRAGSGAVKINVGQGQPLLDAGYLEVSTDPTRINAASYYDPSDPASPIPPVLLGSGATATDITPYLTGGRIGGLIELRDTILPRIQAELDEFAVTLARRFEAGGLTLFTDGTGAVPVGYVAPPAALDYVGFAGEIMVSDTVRADTTILRDGDAGQPGGTTYPGYRDQLQTVLDEVFGAPTSTALHFATDNLGPGPRSISTRLPADVTLATYATEQLTAQGLLRMDAARRHETAKAVRDQFEQRLADESGVNVDQEIGFLIQLQRSYASTARLVTTNREMFDALLRAAG